MVTFRTNLFSAGKTATGIVVPPEVVEALGSGKKPAVNVTINGGYTYRSTVATMGGEFLLPVSAENRNGAGVQAGDDIEVTLELDTAPREIVPPEDFATALDAEPAARQFWETLSYSNKRRFVLSIDDAKTPETRARRIDSSVAKLREGKV